MFPAFVKLFVLSTKLDMVVLEIIVNVAVLPINVETLDMDETFRLLIVAVLAFRVGVVTDVPTTSMLRVLTPAFSMPLDMLVALTLATFRLYMLPTELAVRDVAIK